MQTRVTFTTKIALFGEFKIGNIFGIFAIFWLKKLGLQPLNWDTYEIYNNIKLKLPIKVCFPPKKIPKFGFFLIFYQIFILKKLKIEEFFFEKSEKKIMVRLG